MTEKSRSFELLVGRILTLSRDDLTDVVCDDRVIDPDGEGRTRQVDITYKRNGSIVHVECRDHRSPQDVKWIEELIGRRSSLKPDVMIGVSSSGFTSLALKKAEAHGIILRSVQSVSDREILSWGVHVIVSVRFVRFDCVNFVLSSDTKLGDENFSAFRYDAASRHYIGGWLSSIALKFSDNFHEGTLSLKANLNLPSHYLLHPLLEKISGIEVQAFSTVLHQNFQMSSALVTNEEVGATNNRTVVFDYGLSGTELHFSAEKFRWALDFSRVLYPKDCFFTGNITIDFGEPRQMDGCLILGLPATKMPKITPPIVRQKA